MDDVLVLFIPTMTPSCFMQGSQIHNKFALAGVVQAHYCFAATFTFAQLQQLGNDSPVVLTCLCRSGVRRYPRT